MTAQQPQTAQEWAEYYRQNRGQQTYSGEDIGGAIDSSDGFDTGATLPEFLPKSGGVQLRVLPRFDNQQQYWLDGYLYMYLPQGLKRGYSPKVLGRPDLFDDWISNAFPYSETDPINRAFGGLRPKQRTVFLVIPRSSPDKPLPEGIDPNKVHIWHIPRHKCGFLDHVSPEIKRWAEHGVNPVDIDSGFDCAFAVTGKGRNMIFGQGFRFVGVDGQQAGPIMPTREQVDAIINQWKPLTEAYRVLTDEDLQNMKDWWEPVVEMIMSDRSSFIDFSQDLRKAGELKVKAQYWKSGSPTTVAMPPQSQAAQPPQGATPPMPPQAPPAPPAGVPPQAPPPQAPPLQTSPAYSPGVPPQASPSVPPVMPQGMPPQAPPAPPVMPPAVAPQGPPAGAALPPSGMPPSPPASMPPLQGNNNPPMPPSVPPQQ